MKFPKYLEKSGIPPGAPEDFPTGSVERAKALTVKLLSAWELATTTEHAWQLEVRRAKKESTDEKLGFKNFDSYLEATIGCGEQEAETKVRQRVRAAAANTTGEVRPQGRPSKNSDNDKLAKFASKSKAARASENGISHYTQQKLDRLASEHPKLMDQVRAGELSAHAAAVQAGIVRIPTPLEQLKRIWKKASKNERGEFVDWIGINGW